jgi:rifampicin phosphotransferase
MRIGMPTNRRQALETQLASKGLAGERSPAEAAMQTGIGHAQIGVRPRSDPGLTPIGTGSDPVRITTLDRITPADEARSGAKAYNCGRLKQAGFGVPDGLVVLSTASDAEVAELARHPWFDEQAPEVRFAVRSSGIGEDSEGQSFAGIHQTTLDVRREDVPAAVAACRASGQSPQALEYRRAKRLSVDAIQMGVLVQQMVRPVAAGVAFTINPVSGADDEIVINSSWGVGEALVSGQVDPDEFVVRKHDGDVLWSRIGEKTGEHAAAASLSLDRVRELAAIVIAIERHYGTPQDVEWCFDGRDFSIVQSRPVTAVRVVSGEIEWTRANLAEVLPDVTSPQALAAFDEMLKSAEGRYMGKLMAPEEALGPIVKLFCGRMYFNLTQLRRVCAIAGMDPAEMLKSLGHAEPIQHDGDATPRVSIGERLAAVPVFVRILWSHLRVTPTIRAHEARVREFMSGEGSTDARARSDAEIWSTIDDWFRQAPDYMQLVFLLSGVTFHEGAVRKACKKVGFSFERLVYPQLAVGQRSVSAQQAFDLIALADSARRDPAAVRYLSDATADFSQWRAALQGTAFVENFNRFLQAYGHRGRYESDWALPRYSENPAPLLRAIRAHLDDTNRSAETTRRQERESVEAWDAFTQQLSTWQRWTLLPRVRSAIRKIKQYYVWREQIRSDMVRVVAVVRTWHLLLAERFVERGWLDRRDDYFLLHFAEIAGVVCGTHPPATLRALAAQRAAELAQQRSMRMPLLMRESQLAQLIRAAGVSSRSDDDGPLSGHPVSGGCVEAEVVVVRDPGDFSRMKRGAILVAPATDPSWTPLFTLASGVIVEVGGVLSHASTIAREYGLPAIANVKHATKRLRTGERVRLDAVHGLVHRLQPAPEAHGRE